MSWTKRGADRMARLVSLREMGNLNTWVRHRSRSQHIPLREKATLKGEQYQGRDDDAWLSADLPTLHGPHSNHPWVQVLRALVYGDNRSAAYASHQEIQPTKS